MLSLSRAATGIHRQRSTVPSLSRGGAAAAVLAGSKASAATSFAPFSHPLWRRAAPHRKHVCLVAKTCARHTEQIQSPGRRFRPARQEHQRVVLHRTDAEGLDRRDSTAFWMLAGSERRSVPAAERGASTPVACREVSKGGVWSKVASVTVARQSETRARERRAARCQDMASGREQFLPADV